MHACCNDTQPGCLSITIQKASQSIFLSSLPAWLPFVAGTGKTLLAKAVAGEAGVPFFYRWACTASGHPSALSKPACACSVAAENKPNPYATMASVPLTQVLCSL